MTITTATCSRSLTTRSSITAWSIARVKRRAGLVEQQDLRLRGQARERCTDAAAGHRTGAAPDDRGCRRPRRAAPPGPSAVFDRGPQRLACADGPLGLVAQNVGDVLEHAHRERVWLLEDHRHATAQCGRLERRDVGPVERDLDRSGDAVLVNSVSRFSDRSSVVLPQPDGPIRANTSPWRIGSDTDLTASSFDP